LKNEVTFWFDVTVMEKERRSMNPECKATAGPAGSEALLNRLNAQREKFLAFVRIHATAKHAARRDPEDILQEAFTKAHQRWAEFSPSALSLEAWFYQIVLDVRIDDHRFHARQKRDPRAEMAWPEHSSMQFALGLQNADTSPSEVLSRRDLKERVDRVLATLPPDDQQIMVLMNFAELTGEQAAEVLGIEHGTARQRHVRARIRFRESWKRLFGEEGFG
jgi:RNA polymerase sigma-70 factor (ECF subfamily)